MKSIVLYYNLISPDLQSIILSFPSHQIPERETRRQRFLRLTGLNS